MISVGGGYALLKNLDFDLAFEYARESGSGSMPNTGASGFKELMADTTTESKATAYGVHTGITYKI
jgi:long-subunit fatty acid transport protein